MAAYASKAQALVQRGAKIARTIAPQVKASYTATMAKNAGAQLRARDMMGARLARGDRGASRGVALTSCTEYVVKDPVAAEKLGKQFIYTKLARCAPGRAAAGAYGRTRSVPPALRSEPPERCPASAQP